MLKICNVTKTFGKIIALDNVSITFEKGEIHGLLGRNGAGKSTLVSIIYGWLLPTSGNIYVNDNRIDINKYHPDIAKSFGISFVSQTPLFAEELSIEENLFLGIEKSKNFYTMDKAFMLKKTREILKKIGLEDYHPNTQLKDLSICEKQLLKVGQVLYIENSDIILLDEIAAGISEDRMSFIHNRLKKERDKGKIIIYISHKLKEVIDLCDKVTVLRDGHKIITEYMENLNVDKLVKYIVGKEIETKKLDRIENTFEDYKNTPLLKVNKLYDDHLLKNINFNVYKGEVVGFVGLLGSGFQQMVEILYGKQPYKQGEIYYKGEKISFFNPSESIKRGVLYLSDNRDKESIFNEFTIIDNVMAGFWRKISSFWGINFKKRDELFNSISRKLDLKYGNYFDRINTLSGGNRQKVCVGRLIIKNPSIYLLNEPLKGIDIETKYELLNHIRMELIKESAVIVSSTEIDELMLVSDRIIMFYNGEIVEIITRKEFSEKRIFEAIQGGKRVS